MISASIGVGTDSDPAVAGKEAVTQAISGLPHGKAHLLFVFASMTYDQDKILEQKLEVKK